MVFSRRVRSAPLKYAGSPPPGTVFDPLHHCRALVLHVRGVLVGHADRKLERLDSAQHHAPVFQEAALSSLTFRAAPGDRFGNRAAAGMHLAESTSKHLLKDLRHRLL